MAERVVSIKLVADATGFTQAFGRARDAASELKSKVEESAQTQRQQWAEVGTGLTAVGVAVTGLGVAALKTGVQYNTLQQTTRAALKTLLGSAQDANAQMDKLDEFARNSPFAKQTFIEAQQQMLGFGVATEKVLPALSAVQDTVAAFGGSNEQISSIVDVMSRLQSQGRLSGEALERLGYYGVDAAKIIGDEMGLTSAEIKDMASKPGGIPVDQVWDPLVEGMNKKFGGAAANVKETFAGAMDRVKAAWRDFAAELATPLVDPNGGGALVDLLNWAADAMRAFEDLPGPVKTSTSAVVGLAGGGALLLGTSMHLIPRLMELSDALKVLTAEGSAARAVTSGFARFMTGPYGVALLAAAAVTTVLAGEKAKLSGLARELADTLDAETGAVTENSTAWAANQLQQEGVLSAGKRLGISADDMTQAWLGNADALEKVNARLDKFKNDADFRMENTDWKGWSDDLADVDYALDGSNKVLAEARTRHDELAEATAETSEATGVASGSLSELGNTAGLTSDAINALSDVILGFGKVQIDAERAAIAFEDELAKLNAAASEGALSLDVSTEAGRNNRDMLLDVAEATAKNAAAVWESTGSQEAVIEVLNRGREALIDGAAAHYGSRDAAAAYIDTILATPEAVITQAQFDKNAAEAALSEFQRKLSLVPRVLPVSVQFSESAIYSEEGLRTKYGGGKAYGGTVGYAYGGTVAGVGGAVINGTVYGRGGTKSDSVNVNLSRGEEVIQEPFASMYRPMLKQMNRGDFAPSQPIVLAQPQSGSSAPVSVMQNVYPRPGMSEMEVGRIAASRIGDEVGRLL